MNVIRKSACRWSRSIMARSGGTVSNTAFYSPSRVCVEYETGATPCPQIRRVVIYAEGPRAGKLTIESIVTVMPKEMWKELLDIIQTNEANYGRFYASVILPDGRIIHD